MVKICKGIADSQWFTNFILGVIVLAGVVVGMQTYKEFEAENHALLSTLDTVILWIFVLCEVHSCITSG